MTFAVKQLIYTFGELVFLNASVMFYVVNENIQLLH